MYSVECRGEEKEEGREKEIEKKKGCPPSIPPLVTFKVKSLIFTKVLER